MPNGNNILNSEIIKKDTFLAHRSIPYRLGVRIEGVNLYVLILPEEDIIPGTKAKQVKNALVHMLKKSPDAIVTTGP